MISSALFGFNRESAGEGCVYQAYEDDQCHPSVLHGNGKLGGGDSGVEGFTGRSFGPSVYHASLCVGYTVLFAYRGRVVVETSDRGWF